MSVFAGELACACVCEREKIWSGRSHEGENNNKKQLAEAAVPFFCFRYIFFHNEGVNNSEKNVC